MSRMIPVVIQALLAATLAVLSSAVCADGIAASFSGYGTAGGTFTDNGLFSYRHNPTEFEGASSSFDVGLESRVGLQGTVAFSSQWSVTAQEEAKLRGGNNFDPGTEWLYVQYRPDSDWSVRLGRVVLPSFLFSEVADVGYAVPWFRAPNEVYDSGGINYLDGVQVQWQHSFASVRLQGEFSYGTGQTYDEFNSIVQLTQKANSLWNAAVTVSWIDLRLRYAQSDVRTSFDIVIGPTPPIHSGLHDYFHSYGLEYDNGKALLISEYVKHDQTNASVFNRPLGVFTSWYAGVGWRIGKFTPMVVYSSFDLTDSLLGSPGVNHTWGASLRYDVVRNLALKAQVNRAQANNPTYFVLTSPTSGGDVDVYSLGADFVF